MKPAIYVKFKLWLSTENHEGVFGDGKWRLLKAVEEEGSLKRAAESLGISYRKAWGDLKKAEECLGVRFIEKTRGGQSGGHSTLTEEGKRWIKAYSDLRTDIKKNAEESFDIFLKKTFKRRR
ncbi:winged helix-turn-helix domain-containing protein [Candidatus Latescibacterota bacterium]